MDQSANALGNRPAWVDLSSPDPKAAQAFYASLLGWDVQVSDDPQYGGYTMAEADGVGIAGIGPKMDPNAPTVWSLYIGTADADATTAKVTANGGTIVMAPFDVGDQGRMAVFRDPAGAFFSVWQTTRMRGFVTGKTGAFGWAELNARGIEAALSFYQEVFGWTVESNPSGPDQPPYNEFYQGGKSILGAWKMSPMVPEQVPSYWQIYFNVDDVDAAFAKALALGATGVVAPQEMPGGRFAIVTDPQGASFGLLRYVGE